MNDLQSSFSECLAWWALTFVNGIAFREFSRDPVGRWIGRASVATSCFVLISFCQYATHQCQVQYQVVVITAVLAVVGLYFAFDKLLDWMGRGR